MRIRAGSGDCPTDETVPEARHRRLFYAARRPMLGMAVLSPLVLAAAVGAAGPAQPIAPTQTADGDVTPLVALTPTPSDTSGPSVVAVAQRPNKFHVAAATTSAPPPAVVVNSPGAMRIPGIALSAYRNAEAMMARAYPGCGISWNLLAGIGRIESAHANGGATDARGNPVNPIYGPALDGTLPGNEVIVQSVQSGRVTYVRAMGPMQFLPGTWSRYASDGDGDGKADPQNVYDATLAAARYLCSGNMNLRDRDQVVSAILRYNNSMAYASNVMGWAAAYATGVAPVDLPQITGPTPSLGDTHLEAFQGLGPDMHGTVLSSDPSRNPMLGLSQTDVANQLPVPPGPATGTVPGAPGASPCVVFCISDHPANPAAPVAPEQPPVFTPPWMAPEPPAEEPAPLLTGPAPGPAPGPA